MKAWMSLANWAAAWISLAAAAFPLTASADDLIPARYFARLPKVAEGSIAPGGAHMALRLEEDGQYTTLVIAYDGASIKPIYGFDENEKYGTRWTHWLNAQDLLVSVIFYGRRGGLSVYETRLLTFDVEKKRTRAVFKYDRGENPHQIEDSIVSFLPKQPDEFLVQYLSTGSSPSVFRAKVGAQRQKLVQSYKPGVFDWVADRDGDVRYGSGSRDTKEPYLIIRPKNSEDWIDYSQQISDPAKTFSPLAFSADPDVLYVASNHDEDPAGLFEFNVTTGEFGRLIYRNPEADVTGVRLDPITDALRGVNYGGDDPNVEWLSAKDRKLRSDIYAALGDKNLRFLDSTPDQNYALFVASAPDDPGRTYLFDNKMRALREVSSQYPELDGKALGVVEKAAYRARDGLRIPAIVTLPPSTPRLDDARRLPFVLLPHGGPTSRDYARFDYWAQFLASRGYGVLQMNFRGSTGYGAEFEGAGDREWGKAMQDDIEDGAAWLVEEGYAAPDKLAIMGASYGGYAALMGVVKTPDRYRCAISVNGVSDLPALIRRDMNFVGGAYWSRHIGNLWRDREDLVANSPARNADKVKVPVLLIHGEKDRRVPLSQSKKMARALQEADGDVHLVELDDGDHSITRYPNRLIFLDEVEKFLSACIG